MSIVKTGERGCGVRQPDSLYFECGLSPFGMPIEYFLIDPPIPCKSDKEDIKDITFFRGYQMFYEKEKDIYHLINWVGEENYPSPWDFVEECREKGMSRRVSKDYDFSKLTFGKSCIYFIHKHAIDLDTKDKNLIEKNRFEPQEDIELLDGGKKNGMRSVGDVKYEIKGYDSNKPFNTAAGIYMRLPIQRLTYVKPSDRDTLEKLKELKIPFNIKDE